MKLYSRGDIPHCDWLDILTLKVTHLLHNHTAPSVFGLPDKGATLSSQLIQYCMLMLKSSSQAVFPVKQRRADLASHPTPCAHPLCFLFCRRSTSYEQQSCTKLSHRV